MAKKTKTVIPGQLSIFSCIPERKRKPCEYSFQRYVGQLVRDNRGVHRIAEIEEYYTIYDDNTIGTPHDMIPVNAQEWKESLDCEIKYNEWKLSSKIDTNRSIAKKNLIILRRLRDENSPD